MLNNNNSNDNDNNDNNDDDDDDDDDDNNNDLCYYCLFYLANQLISEGVIAIIGPRTSTAVKAMHSLCSKFHIPQISATATDPDFFYNRKRYGYLLRMSPSDLSMHFAMKNLIQHFKWTRIGILTSATVYGKTMNASQGFSSLLHNSFIAELQRGQSWDFGKHIKPRKVGGHVSVRRTSRTDSGGGVGESLNHAPGIGRHGQDAMVVSLCPC